MKTAFVLSFVVLFTCCGGQRKYPGESTANEETVTPTGLRFIRLAYGSGEEAHDGMMVSVHYTGYLMDGKKFQSSLDGGSPIEFVLGSGRVIKGWEEGLTGMQVGEKRKLIIPPQLGYGDRGMPGVIPPNADLVFDVSLVSIRLLDQ